MSAWLVAPKYSYGLDLTEAVLRDDVSAALAERDECQAVADEYGHPCVFMVFELREYVHTGGDERERAHG